MIYVCSLDYSKNRIGYAIGHLETKIVQPGGIIHARTLPQKIQLIQDIVTIWQIDYVVFGIPLCEDHSSSATTRNALFFFRRIKKAMPSLRYFLINEYLSSFTTAHHLSIKLRDHDHYVAVLLMEDWMKKN